jgi:hypothetical protein
MFSVTNRGRLSVHDVSFFCGYYFHLPKRGEAFTSDAGVMVPAPVKLLEPGKSIARTCYKNSNVLVGFRPLITVNYRWPIIGLPGSVKGYFSVVRGVGGFFLAPDLPE